MGMIEYAAKVKPTPASQPRSRAQRPAFTLVAERGSLQQHQEARTRSGQPALVKFTAEAEQMWKRIKAAGGTPKVIAYSANYVPTRTRTNPTGKTEITVEKVGTA